MKREPWDYEKALEEDRQVERRLPVWEGVTILLVLIILSIRLFLA